MNRLMRVVALALALAGCVNLPVDVRAELDCDVESGADHFGNERCAASAR